MSKKTKLATLAMTTLILTACNSDEESSPYLNNEVPPVDQVTPTPDSDYNNGNEALTEGTGTTNLIGNNWLTIDDEPKAQTMIGQYGNKSNSIFNSFLNKVSSKAKENSLANGNTSKGETPPAVNTNPVYPEFEMPSYDIPQQPDTGTSTPNADVVNPTPKPVKEENNEVSFDIQTELKDPSGNTTSSGISNDKFNVYDYVSKTTPVVTGNSKEQKLFGHMDKLTKEIVVTLDKDNISTLINKISSDYKNKLLVDSFSYGKLSKDNDKNYLIEIEYLVTSEQLSELQKFAKEVSSEVFSLSDENKYKAINKKIGALGQYDDKRSNIYSPFSLFKEGYGVCQAYTSLGQIIFNQMGVQNGIATGNLNGVPHTWNVVNIGGKLLHIDFTLNDFTGTESYILLTEDQIKKTRSIDRIIM